MKKIFLIGLALLALIAIAVLTLPPLVDLAPYKSRYLPLVEDALQRKIDVGEVRFRIFPTSSVRISALNVSDNPAFSRDPFFTAQQIRLKLKLWPLLRGEFRVDELILEKPAINLRQQPDGTFNFADIGKKKGTAKIVVLSMGSSVGKSCCLFLSAATRRSATISAETESSLPRTGD